MSWGKVDDKLHSSMKWRMLSKPARALWTTSLSWCMDQLTDGRVPARMLAYLDGVPEEAAELVEVGLWEPAGDGWVFHDWTEYQPSREQVMAERKAAADRQKRARERAKEKRDAERHGVTHGVGHGSVTPDVTVPPTRPDPTRPVTTETPSVSPAPATAVARPAKRSTRIPEPFQITPEMVAWARENAPGIDHRSVTESFVDYWRAQPGQRGVKADWPATWRNWLRREAEKQPRGTQRVTADQRVNDGLELARRLAREAS